MTYVIRHVVMMNFCFTMTTYMRQREIQQDRDRHCVGVVTVLYGKQDKKASSEMNK